MNQQLTTTTMEMVDSGLKRIQSYQETLDYNWWDKFWASLFGASTNLGGLDQSIRSLAVEIATLTRRQQRGKGLRMA